MESVNLYLTLQMTTNHQLTASPSNNNIILKLKLDYKGTSYKGQPPSCHCTGYNQSLASRLKLDYKGTSYKGQPPSCHCTGYNTRLKQTWTQDSTCTCSIRISLLTLQAITTV